MSTSPMESKRGRELVAGGKGPNTAFPDLSSAYVLSRDEGESAEQSHEKRVR